MFFYWTFFNTPRPAICGVRRRHQRQKKFFLTRRTLACYNMWRSSCLGFLGWMEDTKRATRILDITQGSTARMQEGRDKPTADTFSLRGRLHHGGETIREAGRMEISSYTF